MLIRRIARPMLAATFVSQGAAALSRPVPATDDEVPARVTAAAQIGGGLLLATGRLPRLAAAVLAASVVPANLLTQQFWREPDPARRAGQQRDFMAGVSLLGGLLIASADTAGRPSLAWLGRRKARTVADNVAAKLPSASAP